MANIYELIEQVKAEKSLSNGALGKWIGKSADAFRMALKRKSLTDLEIAEIQKKISDIRTQGGFVQKTSVDTEIILDRIDSLSRLVSENSNKLMQVTTANGFNIVEVKREVQKTNKNQESFNRLFSSFMENISKD